MKQLLRKPFYLIAILIVSFCYDTTQLLAQAGTLDLSFGDSGIVYPNIKISFSNIALQSNNKIIVSGNFYNRTVYITTSRFKPNGTIDSSYGENGNTKTNFEGYIDNAYGYVAVQDNDKLVIAGWIGGSLGGNDTSKSVVFRLLKNGKPDSSFGNNSSIVKQDSIGFCSFNEVLIQPNGKIVCAGSGTISTNYNDFLLYRFNVNGTPDSTFGKNGVCTIDFSHNDDFLGQCLLKPNGQIISSGGGYYGNVLEMAETGISGHLIKDFGAGGEVIKDSTGGRLIGMQSNGRLLIITYDKNGSSLLAFTSNGIIDSSFGKNGIYHLKLSGLFLDGFCIQDDDKIIGTGTNNHKLCVVRLLPSGNVDSSFADNGIFTLQNAPNASGGYILLQPNKKILVSGILTKAYKGILIRLNNDVRHEPIAATPTEQ